MRGTPSDSGLWSWGEYATAISDVLAFRTRTRFWALGEAAAGPAKARLFEFRVEKHHSQWKVRFGATVIPAYTGKVWLDPETARVLRMELHTGLLPDTFEAESVDVSVDLDWTFGGGRTFVLPKRAEVTAIFARPRPPDHE